MHSQLGRRDLAQSLSRDRSVPDTFSEDLAIGFADVEAQAPHPVPEARAQSRSRVSFLRRAK